MMAPFKLGGVGRLKPKISEKAFLFLCLPISTNSLFFTIVTKIIHQRHFIARATQTFSSDTPSRWARPSSWERGGPGLRPVSPDHLTSSAGSCTGRLDPWPSCESPRARPRRRKAFAEEYKMFAAALQQQKFVNRRAKELAELDSDRYVLRQKKSSSWASSRTLGRRPWIETLCARASRGG